VPVESDRNWLSEWWYGEDMVHFPVTYGAPAEDNGNAFDVVIEEPEKDVEPNIHQAEEPVVLVPVEADVPSPEPVQEVIESPVIEVPKNVTDEMLGEYIPKSVEFEQAKSEILAISYPELDKLAALLVNNPNRHLTIEGHTDYVGDPAKNLELSERRARAVAAYLIKKGGNHTQINSAKGYGGSRPIEKSNDKKYHPENRRVDFILE
jgi:outer membrane protein OmpA-like peptidoglycan-associated protein